MSNFTCPSKADMDEQLLNTPVTGKYLEQLLAKSPSLNLNGNHMVSVEAKIAGENQGFTSKILRVHLNWSDPSADLPKSVIVKVIGSTAIADLMPHMTKEQTDHMYEQLFHAHNIECIIYEMEELKKVVPMPHCYAKVRSVKKEPGIIILEDLGDRGVVFPIASGPWIRGLKEEQVDQILDVLATIHAWSLNNTEWREVIPSLKEFNVMAPLVESMVVLYPASKKRYPDIFKDLDEERVKECINAEKYGELFGCDCKAKYNLPMVMAHGDVHFMNMMFEKKLDGSVGDKLIAMLDWQISHQGCAAEDLTRVFALCLSTEQRREKKDKIIRRYVELFNSKVTDPENHIIFEDMRRAIDDMFAFFGIMWSSGIVMMDQMSTFVKDLDEKEMEELKQRIIDFNVANYNDAMEMIKW